LRHSGRRGSGRLVLSGLTKRYGEVTAVDEVDLDVAPSEFVTLLGPSGSGKTTTLMMVAGFTPPTSGDIRIDDRSITDVPPDRRNIGVVFQSYALFPHMSVADNVAFPLRMRQTPRAAVAQKVASALDMVRLSDYGARLPRQLSGGQQQRVALARALVFDPELLLMDEPLGALDRNLRDQMKEEITRLHRALGVTVLYVTHDQEEALTLSDRVVLMHRGRIEQVGAAPDLYERPRTTFAAEFIGESNLLRGRLVVEGGGAWFVSESGIRLRAPDATAPLPGGPGLFFLRPEKIALAGDLPRVEGDGGASGTVEGATYAGDVTRYRVRISPEETLLVKVSNKSGAARPALGEAVRLAWNIDDARLLPLDKEDA
jgi:putative spermidine/putrescine transport system ATP-binding protein